MLEAQFIPVQQQHWPISCWNQSAAEDKLWYWHRAIDLDLIIKKDLFHIRKGDILKTQWCNRVFYIFRDILNQGCYLLIIALILCLDFFLKWARGRTLTSAVHRTSRALNARLTCVYATGRNAKMEEHATRTGRARAQQLTMATSARMKVRCTLTCNRLVWNISLKYSKRKSRYRLLIVLLYLETETVLFVLN